MIFSNKLVNAEQTAKNVTLGSRRQRQLVGLGQGTGGPTMTTTVSTNGIHRLPGAKKVRAAWRVSGAALWLTSAAEAPRTGGLAQQDGRCSTALLHFPCHDAPGTRQVWNKAGQGADTTTSGVATYVRLWDNVSLTDDLYTAMSRIKGERA